MEILTDLPGQLDKLPIAVVIMLGSIAVGLVLKKARLFPNRFIPLIVVPINGLLYWLCGNTGSISPDIRHPEAVLWLYGILLGFVAWSAHRVIFKRLEKFLPAGFFPKGSFDTEEFKKEPEPAKPKC